MHRKRVLTLASALFVVLAMTGQIGPGASAAPSGPTDESKVPHYFGPNPNWANSPFAMADAVVTITGNGTGATAEATVGANGGVTAITVTDGGSGYSQASVQITGSGTGATAKANIVKKGAVVGITVSNGGTGYTAPTVSFTGGGSGTGAEATAYGSVEAVSISDLGAGYTYPTVAFDLPDDPNGVQAEGRALCTGDVPGQVAPTCVPANPGETVTITGVEVTKPGSGYAVAPGVAIHNGTLYDPITLNEASQGVPGHLAVASSSLSITDVVIDASGSQYTQAPTVVIADPTGSGATAVATLDNGVIASIAVTKPGSGYIVPGGIRKFQDQLPGLCVPPTCPTPGETGLNKAIPLAMAEPVTYDGVVADQYVIALVQYRMSFSSSLPPTLVRGYVQVETPGLLAAGKSQHIRLENTLMDGTKVQLSIDGQPAYGVSAPMWLGPTIVASKDKPVRIVFHNLLPGGADGDLFLPTDTTIMGSGPADHQHAYDPTPQGGDVMDEARNPMCTEKYDMPAMRMHCFTENRATLHLHGGNTPWISDGTPHQWITPPNEATTWPQGVSVQNVPDMVDSNNAVRCEAKNDGCQTFFYTNQQSARLMFYHDHAWGITRLNVYAGEAAGYVIQDETEQKLFGPTGLFPDLGVGLPLVIQDRTFVPTDEQLYNDGTYGKPTSQSTSYGQDPTWDAARWGGYGNFWYHHVYMTAQNPGDPSGMSGFGRWMYGPWFWPPAGDAQYGPIANPYFDPACSLDDPATWQYQEDPFCEPAQIPGTPLISAGMEQFNDTPIVNGTAYPTLTVSPKAYRMRVLNAANDRFWNLQWYVADATGTEVALNAAEVAAAQTDPVVFPTPDLNLSPAGPDWIQIGTEGGFLPHPVVVDGQQVTTWIRDPTRFDVGNVDQHSLLLAPAERADVIVDFSKFRGKTLILYNDAPAAFPARIPSYDYYTGAPDLSPVGAPTILPGYGPNTRTIMQIRVANTAAAKAFPLNTLKNAFLHKANGSGVFESGQHPIIVGQAQYNSAYGTTFASAGNCTGTTAPANKCDGFARINQQGGDTFWFDTLKGATSGTWAKLGIPLEPKAIHDETNASSFDEFGRMQANLGVEVVPATPGLQNVVLHPYVFSPTEIIDTSGLPSTDVTVTPIASQDGTQIWKVTHNGVDTHPIHFHAYDVQILNRVTWDNIIIPPDETELGWKDTIRIAPLEDTIVALRPVTPVLPFDFPNAVRLLSPMMADEQPILLSSVDELVGVGMRAFAPNGEPIDVYNHLINFGAEYVYHCHILSHEEMDMMRPVILAYPPMAPTNLAFDAGTKTLSWTDASLSETQFVVEKSSNGGPWEPVGDPIRTLFDVDGIGPAANAGTALFPAPLPTANQKGGTFEFIDPTWIAGDQYRVVAQNIVGDTWNYADANLNEILSGGFPTAAPSATSAVLGT